MISLKTGTPISQSNRSFIKASLQQQSTRGGTLAQNNQYHINDLKRSFAGMQMNSSVVSQRKTEVVQPVEMKATSGFEEEDDEEDSGMPIVKRTETNKAWLALHGQAPEKDFYSVIEGRQEAPMVEQTTGYNRYSHSMAIQQRQTTQLNDN